MSESDLAVSRTYGPARLPLRFSGTEAFFNLICLDIEGSRWVVAWLGDISDGERVLTRIESACVFGHVFMSSQCDCRDQLHGALSRMSAEGRGLVIYGVDHDARGLGIEAHFEIYRMRQVERKDTSEIFAELNASLDSRDHSTPARILEHVGVHKVALLTNNADRVEALRMAGIDAEREPHEVEVTRFNMSTLFLEKEDLNYKWSFTTHVPYLLRLPAGPGILVRVGDETVHEEETSEAWDIAWDRLPTVDGVGILYSTHVPPLDVLELVASRGIQVIVVPTSHIDETTTAKAEQLSVRVTDWVRGTVAERLDQWDPVGSSATETLYENRLTGNRRARPRDPHRRAGWRAVGQRNPADSDWDYFVAGVSRSAEKKSQ